MSSPWNFWIPMTFINSQLPKFWIDDYDWSVFFILCWRVMHVYIDIYTFKSITRPNFKSRPLSEWVVHYVYVIAIWSLWLSSFSWKKNHSLQVVTQLLLFRYCAVRASNLLFWLLIGYTYIYINIYYTYIIEYIWVCVYIYIYCTPRKQQLKSLKKIIKCKFSKHKQIYTYTLLYKTIYTLNEEWQYHHGLVFNVHHVNYHVNDLKMIFCKCRSEI